MSRIRSGRLLVAMISAVLFTAGCGESRKAARVDPARQSAAAEVEAKPGVGESDPVAMKVAPAPIETAKSPPSVAGSTMPAPPAADEEAEPEVALGATAPADSDSADLDPAEEELLQNEPVADESSEVASEDAPPAFRLLLPTTAGPIIVDVDIRLGNEPLAAAFDRRVQLVMDEASESDELTWQNIFEHVSGDPQQFGRASSVNSQQYSNLIRLFDKNRNRKAEFDEVARFLFRNTRIIGPFRLVGSDYYRGINRTQSAVFAAMDSDDSRILEPVEVDRAGESLRRIDHNGDGRIDFDEVTSLPEANDPAWNNRRSGRWGEVAMDLTGYVDWQMVSYNLVERAGGAFGQSQSLFARLDVDRDQSIDVDEARSLLSVEPDVRWRVEYPLVGTGGPGKIEIISVSDELEELVQRNSSAEQVTMDSGSLRLIARVADSRAGGNQIPPEAFAALDANNDGGLEESEIPELALREYSFEDLDQDEDGKLTLREINEGMSPKSPIWNVQVRARGAEVPDGVLAWLDKNQDYTLSAREILGASDRLRQIATPEGTVRPADIPDAFLVQFGRGDPDQDAQLFALRSPLADQGLSGSDSQWPKWAQSMDTNRDGDISRYEFPGTVDQFDRLDTNADGFIDMDELLAP